MTAAHAFPFNDAICHELDPDCVCGPEKNPVFHPAHPRSWLYLHHSLDGREQRRAA